jgi:hypothetical protein
VEGVFDALSNRPGRSEPVPVRRHRVRRGGRAHAALPGCVRDPHRLRLRRRHLGGGQGRRHRPAPELAPRRGALPALLARRRPARIQRQLRRQHRRLCRRRVRWHAAAGDLRPEPGPAARLEPRRLATPVRVAAGQRHPRHQPALPRAGLGRPPGAPAHGLRRVRRPLTGRAPHRLLYQGPRLPRLEALPRRHRPRHLALRPRDPGVAQPDGERRQRRLPDVARRHALLPVRPRPRAALQHLGAGHFERRAPAGHQLRGLRTSSSRPAAGSISSGSRTRRCTRSGSRS